VAERESIQEVVVTGTATGLKKLDASFSITTASLEEIRTANPSSAAGSTPSMARRFWEDWFFSLGGFYRNSNGIRKPQFPADDGGQLTGTLHLGAAMDRRHPSIG
jgi:hypothetical protein